MTPSRILIVGSGAREHALAWRLAQDPGVVAIDAAPGNAGIAQVATVHHDVKATDINGLVDLARRLRPDLVVVGPEVPLAAGLTDHLSSTGSLVFGPSRSAAALESSKGFCRRLAESVGIPMAEGRSFSDRAQAFAFVRALAAPVAVKAVGLAAGKGVRLCQTLPEAEAAIVALGPDVVVERLLAGPEASVMAICDGERAVALPVARDYKRAADGDTGPNTGGMGAYSPLPDLEDAAAERLLDVFHRPVLAEMARRGTPFRGVLYAGLIFSDDGPRLLEFNVRFGDPEAEVILPRVRGNFAQVLASAASGALSGEALQIDPDAAVAVVLGAQGYPEAPRTGDEIIGVDATAEASALVFHGATARVDGQLKTAGGRVLTVVGRGRDLAAARRSAYQAAASITFDGQHYRSDIAAPALVPA